jgi:hypothetical protein
MTAILYLVRSSLQTLPLQSCFMKRLMTCGKLTVFEYNNMYKHEYKHELSTSTTI